MVEDSCLKKFTGVYSSALEKCRHRPNSNVMIKH